MTATAILQPVVALAGWTMVVWLWMYAVRIPAMQRSGIDSTVSVGGTGRDLDAILPERVQWKAHNFAHLHESPTVFYAIALVLAVSGHGGGGSAVALAWAYVALRLAHSLVQMIYNRVVVRWVLYTLSNGVLSALVILAARAVA
ncbi:MAPEG family protein [Novosphingobium sp.]|uniref:MAPEG family protein n=1 Tax=Novosphingobium sp. TaxID=1874826 RepID=UPI002603A441|nr:MAPEG family protein [Novosphingobium sp.]